MDKFRVIYNVIIDIWNMTKKRKDDDFSLEQPWQDMVDDSKAILTKYMELGEAERNLAEKIIDAIMDYLEEKQKE